jgi:hypothetical protein
MPRASFNSSFMGIGATKKTLARQLVGSWGKMLWAYSVINREVAARISNQ